MERYVTIKIILLGDSNVGKTRISSVLDGDVVSNSLTNSYVTVGVDYRVLHRTIYNDIKNVYKIHLWDCGGLEQYRNIGRAYFRSTVCGVIIYDVNNRESFNNVETWINDYLKTTKIHNKQSYRTFMIVGNKIDNLNRKVTFEEGFRLSKKLGCDYVECSAIKNINTESIITKLISKIEDDILTNKAKPDNSNLKVVSKNSNNYNYYNYYKDDKVKPKSYSIVINEFFINIFNCIKNGFVYCFSCCLYKRKKNAYFQIL